MRFVVSRISYLYVAIFHLFLKEDHIKFTGQTKFQLQNKYLKQNRKPDPTTPAFEASAVRINDEEKIVRVRRKILKNKLAVGQDCRRDSRLLEMRRKHENHLWSTCTTMYLVKNILKN